MKESYTPQELSNPNAFIDAVMKRDASKWSPLVRGHLGPRANSVEHEDLLLRFYVKVYYKADRILELPPEFIDEYLAKMLHNLLNDFWRKRKRELKVDQLMEYANELQDNNQVDTISHEELFHHITNFLKRVLSVSEYEVMCLVLQDYKEQEIADLLDVPLNTVATRKSRARLKIKNNGGKFRDLVF